MRNARLARDANIIVFVVDVNLLGSASAPLFVQGAGDTVAIIEEALFKLSFQEDAVVNIFNGRFLTHYSGGNAVGPGIHQQADAGFFKSAIEVLPIDQGPVPHVDGIAVEI